MTLNISTLVVGEKYRNYCDLLLYSLNLKSDGDVNVFITHDGNYSPNCVLFNNLNIHTNSLHKDHEKYLSKRHFPFFLKNESIKYALSHHKDDDLFIHLDCDSIFKESPNILLKNIYENFKDKNGLYAFKNHGFKSDPNAKPKLKGQILLNGINYNFGSFCCHKNPDLYIWFFEGFMFFNLLKTEIECFTKKWDDVIMIMLKNDLTFRPDSVEIATSCYHSNINMYILDDYFKTNKFAFLNKKKFDELFLENNNIHTIYEKF
jgi:hypothetical protein